MLDYGNDMDLADHASYCDVLSPFGYALCLILSAHLVFTCILFTLRINFLESSITLCEYSSVCFAALITLRVLSVISFISVCVIRTCQKGSALILYRIP